jgi:hypothetical protein
MKKPTHKEISNKLRQAREALTKGKMAIVAPDVIAADALELDYEIEELKDILDKLLEQAKPDDYAGTSPPQQSYVDDIFQRDLFAFSLKSSCFAGKIYFKFALKGDTLWLVSLHKDRPEKGG